jgi:hypothetical protein
MNATIRRSIPVNHRFACRVLALLLVALCASFTVSVASAHGHTEVGPYSFVIGFKNEPAYQGEPNGLDLTVTETATKTPVTGLEDSLKVTLTYGGTSKELEVRPQWGKDGAYTAYVIPTVAGDYTWHITGDIKGTPVDVTMTSSPETFSAVQAKDTVQFPAPEATAAALAEQAADAVRTAQLALLVGGLGLLLGVVGTVVGVLGWRARRAASAPAGRQRVA